TQPVSKNGAGCAQECVGGGGGVMANAVSYVRGVAAAELRERITQKVAINSETGCWEWTGAKHRLGYGVMRYGPRHLGNAPAHRVSFEAHRGPIPEGMVLDHLCRVRGCVNPEHLE